MFIVVFSTAKDHREGKKIADSLISKKLAACVNIVSGVDSYYWWKGKLERSREVLLIIKTSKILLGKVKESIKNTHSYEVPEIIALPIVAGERKYLKWLGDSILKKA